MNNWDTIWNIFCDDVAKSIKKNNSEYEFEKGIAIEFFRALDWYRYNQGLQEQFPVEFATSKHPADIALFPVGQVKPEIIVELKRPKNKKATKNTQQLIDYMDKLGCSFGILMLGNSMEVYYIDYSTPKHDARLVEVIKYQHGNEAAHELMNVMFRSDYHADQMQEYCHKHVKINKSVDYWCSKAGKAELMNMMLERSQLPPYMLDILRSTLTIEVKRKDGLSPITHKNEEPEKENSQVDNTGNGETNTEATAPAAVSIDIVKEFATYASMTVRDRTVRTYVNYLKKDASAFIRNVVDSRIESVFAIANSQEMYENIETLKGNGDYNAANKACNGYLSASLLKYLDFLRSREGLEPLSSQKKQSAPKQKKEKKAKAKGAKRPNFKFWMIDLKVGDEVIFTPRGWTVKVASDDTVEYNGESLRMSTFCKKYLPDNMRNKDEAYQGPAFFSLNGKSLADIRDEREGVK